MSAPRAAVSVLHWAQGALRERRARRAIARIVPFSRLSEADRSELIVSRRRVLQGVEHVHRSSTAAPEVQHLRTEDLHLTVLRDVLVDVHHGFALTRSGLILEDTAIARGPIERKLHSGKLLRPTRVVPVDRPVMCLECGPKNANFFHFWFESMTKLLWVREEEVARLGPSILAHSRTLAPWQRSLLDAALPPDVELLQVDRLTRLAAPVYVDLPPYRGTALDPATIATLRAWSAPLVDGTAPGPRRLAISRRGTDRRRLLNEAALEQLLVDRGFTVVALEDHEVGQQIRLFQDADVIVAQHGAGLTHLLHARPGTRVLEIQPADPDRIELHYRGISATAGIAYSNVFCGGPDRDSAAEAPLDEIVAWLDLLDGADGRATDGPVGSTGAR